MQYRLYQPEDFEKLYAIEEICFQRPLRFTRRYMRRLTDAPDTATWMAERNGDLTGFAILEWAEQVSGVVAYIATIEVLPEWRGQGIGAALLQRLDESAVGQNAIAIWLHVDAENAKAIQLYERSGYVYSGRAEHFYERNRPAGIYVKSLG
jgi:ribosomal protein S18 acetylase RimI-like enzyme